MPFAIEGKLEGLGEAIAKLRSLGGKAAKKAAKAAIGQASKILLREAKSRVVERTGLLKKSLGRKIKAYRKSGVVVGIVGPRVGFRTEYQGRPQDPAKYAHLVELGTKAHAVGKGSSTRKSVASGAMHPGAKAKPFLRPAFDATKDLMIRAIGNVVANAIEDAAKGKGG